MVYNAYKAESLNDSSSRIWFSQTSLSRIRHTSRRSCSSAFKPTNHTLYPLCLRAPLSPKSIPWFVSDVTPPDFASLFTSLLSPTFFLSSAPSDTARTQLEAMVNRWQQYLEKGAFTLSVPTETKLGEKRDGMYNDVATGCVLF